MKLEDATVNTLGMFASFNNSGIFSYPVFETCTIMHIWLMSKNNW